jgi:hypothetical protein
LVRFCRSQFAAIASAVAFGSFNARPATHDFYGL